jgi:hypothetical protein
MGQVTWEIQDFYGVKRQITIIFNHIPKANVILFFPKLYCNEQNGDDSYHMTNGMMTLTLRDGTPTMFPFTSQETSYL